MKLNRIVRKSLLLLTLCGLFASLCAQERWDSIHVRHYTLDLDLTHFQEKTLYGHAELQIEAKTALPEIRLDLLNLQTDSVHVDGEKAAFTHEGYNLRIAPDVPCKAGDSLKVEVWYHGNTYNESFGGYYFAGDYTFNMGIGIKSIPHNMGKSWFPCVDVFADKATYTYRVLTHSDHRAACGGILTDSIRYRNMTTRWIWEQRQPIPTYLASVATGPYQVYRDSCASVDGRRIPIEIDIHPDYLSKVPATFTRLKSVFQQFESRFGPYPFDKVGYVSVNFNNGAMEHAGNIGYPLYAITGDWSRESLYAHELAHAWFGDKVTCTRIENVWLKEGFATWSESLLAECFSHPGTTARQNTEAYRQWFRNQHHNVLLNTKGDSIDYYALDSVPLEHTYDRIISYDKASLIVYNLRSYMGDSLFFHCMKSYMQEYAYSHINSENFFRFLAKESGLPMEDCYRAWIAQPGFLHFSVDSVVRCANGNYRTFLRQRLYHARYCGNSQKVSVRYFFADSAARDITYLLSGTYGTFETTLPQEPLFTVVDWNDEFADAIIDTSLIFNGKKTIEFDAGDVRLKDMACDSQWIRLEHHLVAPDALKTENPHIYRISPSHYWRILCTAPQWNAERLFFSYHAQGKDDMDYDMIQGYRKQDYVLLYRPDPSSDWRIIEFKQTGTVGSGNISTGFIRNGEYCLGVGDTVSMDVKEAAMNKEKQISLYPNPVESTLKIRISDAKSLHRMVVFNAMGQLVSTRNIYGNEMDMDVSALPKGLYFIDFKDNDEKSVTIEKFIVK